MISTTDKIAIIGPGMTGASLAALFAGHGFMTTMLGTSDSSNSDGMRRMNTCFSDLVTDGLITRIQADSCIKRVRTTLNYSDIADSSLIYECVYENAELKRDVYSLVERHCTSYKVLLSATSAILPDELAMDLSDPSRFLVAHPWNPPHLVPCVEVVKCEKTSDSALTYTLDMLNFTGRAPIVMSKPAPGFIGNRLQHALYREAVYMVENGIATAEDIDSTILTSFGPRFASVGLFEHYDNVGLKTARSVQNYLLPYLCAENHAGKIIDELIEKNELGILAGKGMREWSGEKAEDFRRRAAAPFKAFFNWKLPDG